MNEPIVYDMLIVGGGINGAGIARDAAGRGLKVLLVEQDDLASHTSAASTKLIHGGLRYLEYYEFRLVREALIERERLLAIAPHIIWPLEFVLPQKNSPRPSWMVRLGLFLYDHLGGRKKLPATRTIRLDEDARGNGLRPNMGRAFVYSDCWVEDSRLVALNALDAATRGAAIRTRTRLVSAERVDDLWHAAIEDESGAQKVRARVLVNAAGPWVADVIGRTGNARNDRGVRLVKGSHIIVPRLYEGDHAFLLQNPDRRVIFAIPYEGEFTLIGTTDLPWDQAPGPATISPEETRYLIEAANAYFARTLSEQDVVWTYAGIRPLYDDHAATASAVTRDYVLEVEGGDGRPAMLNIFGGKITTYRKLAEHALEKLAPFLPMPGESWTAGVVLPGGDIEGGDFDRFVDRLQAQYRGLPMPLVRRLARAYGTRAPVVLDRAEKTDDLGEDFGAGLYHAEIDYLVRTEWARTAEDILYRRSKLGLHVPEGAAARIDAYLAKKRV
ncbi:glycerol-3-phosphate dehydrogenase [Flavisphingomonas formosensis]|uniref:glycerol-3-phosphate dehydrogenase n=1 Tax=Flavisphingomonas formosensis TaxID=861534 RepID=UPI0012F9BD76|nr:glycerol-3-phosphate dehydrogenase [Sphingomonas formosensis]